MDRPLPYPSHLTGPYWKAVHEHELKLQRCKACGTYQWYPKALCIECGSLELEWKKVSGNGTIFSYTVIRHAKANPAFTDDVPYLIAIVELEEGPRVYGRLPGTPMEKVKVGSKVCVTFEDLSKDISLPQFSLAK